MWVNGVQNVVFQPCTAIYDSGCPICCKWSQTQPWCYLLAHRSTIPQIWYITQSLYTTFGYKYETTEPLLLLIYCKFRCILHIPLQHNRKITILKVQSRLKVKCIIFIFKNDIDTSWFVNLDYSAITVHSRTVYHPVHVSYLKCKLLYQKYNKRWLQTTCCYWIWKR